MLDKLLNLINLYLIGKTSLREVETYVAENLQEILDSNDENAIEITNRVEADLVEFGEGIIDKATLRKNFEDVIGNKEIISNPPRIKMTVLLEALEQVENLTPKDCGSGGNYILWFDNENN